MSKGTIMIWGEQTEENVDLGGGGVQGGTWGVGSPPYYSNFADDSDILRRSMELQTSSRLWAGKGA